MTSDIDSDISLLQQSVNHLEVVLASFEELAVSAPWKELGYFDSKQHDQIEHLLFRFLVSRGVLVSLALHKDKKSNVGGQQHSTATSPGNNNSNDHVLQSALAHAESSFAEEGISDATHTLRTRTICAAAIALFVYEARLVKCFRNDDIAIAKLNQQYYRSDIDVDTYTKLKLECTDAKAVDGRVHSLVDAYNMLYCNEDTNESIEVTTLDAKSIELSNLTETIAKEVNPLINELASQQTSGRPVIMLKNKVKNKVQHAPIATVARTAKKGTISILRETRATTFKGVSRLKSPIAHLIEFSEEQKRDVLQYLEPGDMIFTYTAGYMSDVFIPGAFKHGITYVGNPHQRKEVGLTADNLMHFANDLPEGQVQTLLEHFNTSTIPAVNSGESMAADVIEAVAEGVIFNNLCHLMDTHVNRLVVLRPRISEEERTDALISIFRFLGSKYDFSFNFGDTSAVVCTEVQYHAFNGKGQLHFELTKRAGNPTLSADDIVNYYLTKEPGSFDLVLLAIEDPDLGSSHDAKVYYGDEGKNTLTKLMKEESR